jgi:RNA recognition motif-containing protein
MNKLHVTSLPGTTTNEDLRAIFERIGPVLTAKVVSDRDGSSIMGVVEMSCAEDVEEILTSNDRISVGGRRPVIWKVEEPTIARRIKAKYTGVHLEESKGRWYVFQVREGRLLWCWMLPKHEALELYRHYVNSPEA